MGITAIDMGRDVARSVIHHRGNNHDLDDIEEKTGLYYRYKPIPLIQPSYNHAPWKIIQIRSVMNHIVCCKYYVKRLYLFLQLPPLGL